ncbi:MAG: hypothetical protein A2487_16900 [Candidatus Raymondbacteria bacterium RifOxyC12_full_50_8]|uniref:Uncharacterized protein n=1 Tax=Candidatus Raymondbacteria bacterium RIFOXYD12_FULL_49_13 TaxID=1817890 RepID=A0A1F7F0C5_UNCRA|nr:MAG: hypothetical protein A2248_21775 [Candidatus Raymondbacteria bacterium RIFOXYA2_FULL_49_16]OGK00068.1 MAG: hypothetical protein A2519_22330 [Candidatus Raymondbacteria bacterium RIFOXYD12_FULL_49_13]OGK01357.1 MAG: hypothetical protein A2487_16900 [Candidatus Raymondbacteria bacterium RifOxyC12_full_50_8]OGK03685.1 MAG: hypothetical protein A2350_13010 [Candidatus Raymondbacteria bacterium RifOxyB12_full_50_8]OGP45057.1 MAG: hypothetical protein A2324_13655 [Candidatus Raymondbacteria b
MRRLFLTTMLSIGLVLFCASGCTKKPSPEEMNKLTEARASAESAEKKLAELRAERAQLEATLDAKKEELRKTEEERDAIKAKLGE